jgi:tripartite-type tricarboxylate transporter receptor subunit TctC
MVATNGGQRSDLDRSVPSVAEIIPGYNYAPIVGLYAHTKTPTHITDKIGSVIAAISEENEVRERLKVVGVEATGSGEQGHADAIRKERARYEPLLEMVGLVKRPHQ